MLSYRNKKQGPANQDNIQNKCGKGRGSFLSKRLEGQEFESPYKFASSYQNSSQLLTAPIAYQMKVIFNGKNYNESDLEFLKPKFLPKIENGVGLLEELDDVISYSSKGSSETTSDQGLTSSSSEISVCEELCEGLSSCFVNTPEKRRGRNIQLESKSIGTATNAYICNKWNPLTVEKSHFTLNPEDFPVIAYLPCSKRSN